jgi:para-nitrobenzyl esterase
MSKISRKNFLRQSAMGLGSVMLFPGFRTPFQETHTSYITANTVFGKIKGTRENGVNIFKGIPYAGSVAGKHRFGRPAPLTPWNGIKDTLQLGTPAMQGANSVYGINEPKPGEDCLFLNVWTPANDSKKRPVMFYNHGGGFSTGSGGSVAQDGANLARFYDVVVVETNHRLNIFGYLYLGEVAGADYKTSGNNGMLDIVDGLKWVSNNISEFGGDPGNVMIFGESGGGAKTSCLYAMPAAAPYFNKASIESGPGVMMTPLDTATLTTRLLFKELNFSTRDWRKILDVPAEDLYKRQSTLPGLAAAQDSSQKFRGIGASGVGGFSPVVDGLVLPAHPFDPVAPEISKNKPLMVGWNEDEYTFFAMVSGDKTGFSLDFDSLAAKLKPRFGNDSQKIVDTYRRSRPNATASNIYVEIMSVTMMGLGSIEIAEKKAKQNGATAYLYNFGFKSGNKVPGTEYPMGTPHAMDIEYKFNNVRPEGRQNPNGLSGGRPERFRASLNFAELWTSFARDGKPACGNQPEWPAYDLSKRATMRIDTSCEVIPDRNREERELWTALGYISEK